MFKSQKKRKNDYTDKIIFLFLLKIHMFVYTFKNYNSYIYV